MVSDVIIPIPDFIKIRPAIVDTKHADSRRINTTKLHAPQPLVGHGLLFIETSRSHSEIRNTVGLLWASDQPDAEYSI